MRLPRVRLTVRWLMVAVAIVALVAWLAPVRRQQESYAARAAIYRRYAQSFRAKYEGRSNVVFSHPFLRDGWCNDSGPDIAATPELQREWAEYCERLASKYERAARYPWLPVPSDPPPPE
jgi:hypothetical protein